MFAITIRERSGQVYTFHFDKPEVLIGRVKGNDVILPKQNISKRHTLVKTHNNKRFVVEDLGSTNGTYVNGHRIATAVEVGPEDKVYLGDFVMNFTDLTDMGAAVPEMPPIPVEPDLGGDTQGEAASFRATQHMANPPADGITEFRSKQAPADGGPPPPTIPPVAPSVDPLSSDLPPVEPLDMPAELMDLGGMDAESPQDFLDRMTGPLDGLQHAMSSDAFKPDFQFGGKEPSRPAFSPEPSRPGDSGKPSDASKQSALSAIPGLASAIKQPSQPKPVSTPAFAAAEPAKPAAKPEPRPPAQPAAPVGGNKLASRPSVPMPASGATRGQVEGDAYYEALANLFRAALHDLRPVLPTDASQMSDADWTDMEDRVNGFVDAALTAGSMPADTDDAAVRRDLIYELAGLGPLEALLDDAAVEAIEINAPAQIFAVREGVRHPASVRFSCQSALSLAVDRLVRATGQTGRTGPHLEGTLVDGTSVYVVWPPLCPAGPAVVLRKPRADSPKLADLVARGTVSDMAASVLQSLVQGRRNVAIVGPVGVGKRTVLNAAAQEIDPAARIVVLEDGQRLRLRQEQVVRVDAAAFGDSGPSALRVVQRLRPDCLLVGDAQSVALADLFDVTSDGLGPWLAVFVARDAADFIERATHAVLLRHPGLSEAVAQARVLRGLDAIAVFLPAEQGFALQSVCEVQRNGPNGDQLVELTAQA